MNVIFSETVTWNVPSTNGGSKTGSGNSDSISNMDVRDCAGFLWELGLLCVKVGGETLNTQKHKWTYTGNFSTEHTWTRFA